jgi:hypothetical protein
MNTRTHQTEALRLPVSFGAARRNSIDCKVLQPDALVHFNALLRTLYRHAESVTADGLVSLVRELREKPADELNAIISERIVRAEKLRVMLKDQNWPLEPNLRVRARLLLAYLDKHDDLIADSEVSIGHLDDALMIELSWPRFESIVSAYQAYRDSNLCYSDWLNAIERRAHSRFYSQRPYAYAVNNSTAFALFRVR